MTTAEKVAEIMGGVGVGAAWPPVRGKPWLCGACVDMGATSESGAPERPGYVRFLFPDESAIVNGPGGWNIEGSAPWSMAGAEA